MTICETKCEIFQPTDWLRINSSLVLVLSAGVPGEALLVELDDGLRTLDVRLPGRHQVRLVTAFPLDEEHQLPGGVRRPDNPLRVQAPVKTPRPLPSRSLGLCPRRLNLPIFR